MKGPSMCMVQVGGGDCVSDPEKHTTIHSSIGLARSLGVARNSEAQADALVDPGVHATMYSGELYYDLKNEDNPSDHAQLCLVEEESQNAVPPSMNKAEVGYTKNVEDVLSSLDAPLQVVHNLDPGEVLQNIAMLGYQQLRRSSRLCPMRWIRLQGVAIGIVIFCSRPRSRSFPPSLSLPSSLVTTLTFRILPLGTKERSDL